MKFLSTLNLLFLLYTATAQDGYSIANAIPIDFSTSDTIVVTDVSSENSTESLSGANGSCHTVGCCSMIVYKIVIPVEGSFWAGMSNFQALAGGMLLYSGASDATDWSDLTFLTAAGNFCGFRDTVYIGRGYNRWDNTPYWEDKASWSSSNEFSIQAGTYYMAFWNHNQQITQGSGTTDITFEFTPYCLVDEPQPEIEVIGNSINILDGDSEPSTSDDTDFGTMLPAGSSVSKTFTIDNVSVNDLDISSVDISGDAAANFSVTTSPSATVSGNSSTTFTVEFTPNTVGENNATLSISNSDCDKALFDFALKAFVLGVDVSGVRGNMLTLNGTDEYVECNNIASSMDGATNFTLEAWINADATQTGNDRIISINTSSGGNVFLFYLDDGVIETYDGSDADTYGGDIRGTGWNHVAVTHNNSKDSVYLNGVLLGAGSASVSAFSSTNQWSIGQEFDGGSTGDFFKGKFDEVRIWNDVRTGDEIRRYMNRILTTAEIKAESENLKAYFQFDNDEAAGTANGVKDIMGNHGTVTNTATYTASEVAVGAGVSEVQTVNADGTYTFADTDVEITFTSAGGESLPNGEIVVTKIVTETAKDGSTNEMSNEPSRYWVIRNYGTNTGLGATVKFSFEDDEIDNTVTTDHYIHKRASNEFETGDWTDLTPSSVSSTAGDNHITVLVSDFSQFATSSNVSDFQPTVLPVELSYFKAYRSDRQIVKLTWQTATELYNHGFEVERKDGEEGEFKAIGWVTGNGTTAEVSNYKYEDRNDFKGTSYYRLKQIDFDGQFEYSQVRIVTLSRNNQFLIYPNPTKSSLFYLQLQSPSTGKVMVYDMQGTLLYQKAYDQAQQQFEINLPKNIAAGLYIVEFVNPDIHWTERLVVE